MTLTRSSSSLSQGSPFIPKKQYTVVYVIKKGYFNLVRHLLDLGVDPNYVSDKDDSQMRSPLILATFIRDDRWAFNVAQNLLEYGASLRQTDLNHLTAIHYCCAFARPHLLELLLNSLDFDLSKSVDTNGNSCIHYAMRSHSLKCLQLLIKKYNSYYMTSPVPYYESESLNEKLNFRNKLGLRPIDLGEEIENEAHNFVYSGRDSLRTCRSTLVEFLSIECVAKLRREAAALAAVAAAAQAAAHAADTEVHKNSNESKHSTVSSADDSHSSHSTDKSSVKRGKKTKPVAKKPNNEQINELDENELVTSNAKASQNKPVISNHNQPPVVLTSPPGQPHVLEPPSPQTAHFASVYEVSQEIKISPKSKVLFLRV
jgi:hypothetical protein